MEQQILRIPRPGNPPVVAAVAERYPLLGQVGERWSAPFVRKTAGTQHYPLADREF